MGGNPSDLVIIGEPDLEPYSQHGSSRRMGTLAENTEEPRREPQFRCMRKP